VADERLVIRFTAQEFQRLMEAATQTAAQAAASATAEAVGKALENVADQIESNFTISTDSADARAGAEMAVARVVAELRRVARASRP
jgi:hypothetical protein